jgi:tRNA pseudouridine32 synthase/23S rRNA pseudouridine746 synthase
MTKSIGSTPSANTVTKVSILYQDDDLLIVDKPENLLTVPGRGEDKQDCLINRLLPEWPSALIVHRLDMATSGIVVIALHRQAQAAMSELFAQRKVSKVYIAIVNGKVDKQGEIDLPLICDWDNRPKQIVSVEHGKPAQTRFHLLQYDPEKDISRVELRPITGRSHQLRVHMLAIKHPILGDYFYAPIAIKNKSHRLLLHAHQLEFLHPITEKPMHITSALPF